MGENSSLLIREGKLVTGFEEKLNYTICHAEKF
jgi:hypothetical protein